MSPIRAIRLPRAFAVLVISLMATVVILAAAPAGAAQVGLGTADSFAVLAGAGITNTGATTITGDVGSFPTTSQTGFGPGADSVILTGTNHAGDSVTQGAKPDLVTAYDDAAGRMPQNSVPVELGGTTKFAGNYTGGELGLTGTLTLDAQGNTDAQFVFKAASTLITAVNSRVLLINGADPCRVVWQVGSSATFNTGTQFVGDVLALTDISALAGATFQGRLMARNGAVTLINNTITRANCVVPAGLGTTSTTPTGGTPTTTPTGGTPSTPFVPTALQPVPGGPTVPGTPTALAGPPPGTPSTPGAPGSPSTPGAPGSPDSPGSPPFALTGSNVFTLIVLGLGLVIIGTLTVVVGPKLRKPRVR